MELNKAPVSQACEYVLRYRQAQDVRVTNHKIVAVNMHAAAQFT